jgi:hypothetical protein
MEAHIAALSGTETGYYSLREASTLTYSYGAMLVEVCQGWEL